MKRIVVLLALFCVVAFAQKKGSFTDPRDKQEYRTVKIGNQIWMAENLNYATAKAGETAVSPPSRHLRIRSAISCG